MSKTIFENINLRNNQNYFRLIKVERKSLIDIYKIFLQNMMTKISFYILILLLNYLLIIYFFDNLIEYILFMIFINLFLYYLKVIYKFFITFNYTKVIKNRIDLLRKNYIGNSGMAVFFAFISLCIFVSYFSDFIYNIIFHSKEITFTSILVNIYDLFKVLTIWILWPLILFIFKSNNSYRDNNEGESLTHFYNYQFSIYSIIFILTIGFFRFIFSLVFNILGYIYSSFVRMILYISILILGNSISRIDKKFIILNIFGNKYYEKGNFIIIY